MTALDSASTHCKGCGCLYFQNLSAQQPTFRATFLPAPPATSLARDEALPAADLPVSRAAYTVTVHALPGQLLKAVCGCPKSNLTNGRSWRSASAHEPSRGALQKKALGFTFPAEQKWHTLFAPCEKTGQGEHARATGGDTGASNNSTTPAAILARQQRRKQHHLLTMAPNKIKLGEGRVLFAVTSWTIFPCTCRYTSWGRFPKLFQ